MGNGRFVMLAACLATAVAGRTAAAVDVTTVRLGVPPAETAGTKRAPALPTAYVVEARTAVKVDGKLDDPVWKRAAPISLGTMTAKGTPSAATQVLLLHRDGLLYIGFRLDEPNVDRMRRSVTRPDGPVYQDDSVEVFLSPRGGSRWCQFIVGAGGALADSKDRSRAWNSGARYEVVVGKVGWSVEMAIPFAALGAGEQAPRMWRGNFYRNRHAGGRGENNAWSPTLRGGGRSTMSVRRVGKRATVTHIALHAAVRLQ